MAERMARAEAEAVIRRETALERTIEQMNLEASLVSASKQEREAILAIRRLELQVQRDLTQWEQAQVSGAARRRTAQETVDQAGADLERHIAERHARNADLMLEPYRNVARGIHDAFVESFEAIWDDGLSGFSSLSSGIERVFKRMLAEMATLAIARPVIVPMVQTVGGAFGMDQGSLAQVAGSLGGPISIQPIEGGVSNMPGSGGIAGAISTGMRQAMSDAGSFAKPLSQALKEAFSPILTGLDTSIDDLGGVIGEGLGGAGVGLLTAGIGNMLGLGMSTSGAAAGGAIGQFLPIPGGGIIGFIVGGTLGKLVGGKTAKAFETVSISAGGDALAGGLYTRGKSDGTVASGLGGAVTDQLTAIAEALGKDLRAGFDIGRIGHRKDEYVFETPNTLASKEFGAISFSQRFATAEEAVAAALSSALERGVVEGLSEASQRILREATNFEKALAKVAQIEALPKQIDDALLAFKAPLEYELQILGEAQAERLKLAREAGIDLAKVEELSALEREDILKRHNASIADDLRALAGSLRDQITDLRLDGSLSTLAPRDQVSAARTQFDAAFALAQSSGEAGDVKAAQAAAREYLSLSRDYNASGTAYVADFERTVGALDTLARALDGRAATEAKRAADAQAAAMKAVIDRQAEVQRQETAKLTEKLDQVNDNLSHNLEEIQRAIRAMWGGPGFRLV